MRRMGTIAIITLFLTAPVFVETGPFSVNADTRVVQNINLTWKYNKGDVTNAEAPDFNDNSWSVVHLPHTFEYTDYRFSSFYRGIGWYRKKVTIDAAYQGKKIFLEFEGAMSVAQVYINGTLHTTHLGGFLPFSVDITDAVTYGGENTIAVRLDNTKHKDIPPERSDDVEIDYCLFGGIYRDVNLVISDKLYIPHPFTVDDAPGGGVFVTTPSVSTSSATVKVRTVVKNENSSSQSCELTTKIIDKNNTAVGTQQTTQTIAANATTSFLHSITVTSPSLWSITSPAMYKAVSEVNNGTSTVDTMITRFGIRSIRFDKNTGFYLNNNHVKLLGTNRHQTFPYIGHALPNRAQVRDAMVLKEMGCNFVRLSHYPQDPSFLDACDSLGILVWEEPPTWGNRGNSDAWKELHYVQVKEMVRRDRNHPCVIVWGVGINEGDYELNFETISQNTCKAEDSTRFTSTARDWVYSGELFDVYGHNCFVPEHFPSAPVDNHSIGYINTEHTGHTFMTKRYDAEDRVIEHSQRHEIMTKEAYGCQWVAGGMGWCAFDYNNLYNHDNGVGYHGVADLFRIPKFAYYFYKSQSAADNYDGSKRPMVFIVSHNNFSIPSTQSIKVLSNCEQVELFVNDVSQGTKSPDQSLAHSPIVFDNITISSPGTLRADGKIGGQVKVTQTLRRPGTASKIVLWSDTDTLKPDGTDIARVVVSVADQNNTVIPTANNKIDVSAQGPGKVICGASGPQTSGTITVEGGQLAFLVQSTLNSGPITVTATASGLAQDQLSIMVPDNSVQNIPKTYKHTVRRPSIIVGHKRIVVGNLDRTVPSKIQLLTLNGRVVKRLSVIGKTNYTFSVAGLPVGVYMVRIVSGAHTFHSKFVYFKR